MEHNRRVREQKKKKRRKKKKKKKRRRRRRNVFSKDTLDSRTHGLSLVVG